MRYIFLYFEQFCFGYMSSACCFIPLNSWVLVSFFASRAYWILLLVIMWLWFIAGAISSLDLLLLYPRYLDMPFNNFFDATRCRLSCIATLAVLLLLVFVSYCGQMYWFSTKTLLSLMLNRTSLVIFIKLLVDINFFLTGWFCLCLISSQVIVLPTFLI